MERFASAWRHGARRRSASTAMPTTPTNTAGAGPSRIMASTIERKAAEIVKVFVFSRKASLTTARPSEHEEERGRVPVAGVRQQARQDGGTEEQDGLGRDECAFSAGHRSVNRQ